MRSFKGYIIWSFVIDIILIAYLFTLHEKVGLGVILLLSLLLIGATFISAYFMNRNK
ncbi:hypothetical protein [Metabacillus malikii]|uniref:Uncharacterized protein n=1 Tax=Metabacillus malikii TaxID=1504265 RepID=A0ABT9ZAZ1_9BACI|nr:hypothetical protein [Metabacillus malikii]MDQ0229434.1 hypothetical protein [Metabacillus malikii]